MKDFTETLTMLDRCDKLAELSPEVYEFLDAVSENDTMRIFRIIQKDMSVDDSHCSWGSHALSIATLCGAKQLIQTLLDAHVVPTAVDLCVAVDRNEIDIVELLCNYGAKTSNHCCNALENATMNNNLEMVKFFMTRKLVSELEAFVAFGIAVRKNRYEIVRVILDNVEVWPNVMDLALKDAIENNFTETFRILIAKGAILTSEIIRYAYKENSKSKSKPTEIVIIIENVLNKNF